MDWLAQNYRMPTGLEQVPGVLSPPVLRGGGPAGRGLLLCKHWRVGAVCSSLHPIGELALCHRSENMWESAEPRWWWHQRLWFSTCVILFPRGHFWWSQPGGRACYQHVMVETGMLLTTLHAQDSPAQQKFICRWQGGETQQSVLLSLLGF